MGRGRKPKPTALKLLNGSSKKDPQRINQSEPDVQLGRPKKPTHIKGDAAKEWAKICDILEGMGLLSQAYEPLISSYCVAYGRWREAEAAIDREGLLIVNSRGDTVRNPAVHDAHKYRDAMHKQLVEMGLTPSSKSKVSVDGQQSQSKWAKYLDGAKIG